MRRERPAAGELAQHESTLLRLACGRERSQRGEHLVLVGPRRLGERRRRDRLRAEEQQRLERLFEPFNRLGAEKSKIEGTGIGLVLSRRLVELMDGELQIASTLGRGTIATLLLKAAEAPSSSPGVSAPPSQHGTFDGILRVLYAEDDEVNVELIRQVVLLRPAVALSVATSGAIALEMARRDPPDLMLVDMNLGDMTGLELARALAASPATAGLRLVALSADALPEQISTALAAGFESYLTKPVDFRKLLNVLDGALNAEA